MPTHIQRFLEPEQYAAYQAVHVRQQATLVDIDFWSAHRKNVSLLKIPSLQDLRCSFNDVVTVSGSFQNASDAALLNEIAAFLLPWRKGPFDLMGIEVDAEWRSDLKWARIKGFLGNIQKQRVADIGCNNGYYMFRMLPGDPECVIGFDPNARFYYQFDLVNRFVRSDKLQYEVLGVEHMPLFPNCFDVVLCMGVLYHRRDPIQCLQDLRECLRPGGKIILESITVPGVDDYCLFPKERYAMMRNVWFVPTPGVLVSWMKRLGFKNIEILDETVTTSAEQRKTVFAPWDSLSDFLDPNDPTKTVEGYPAPSRTIIGAVL